MSGLLAASSKSGSRLLNLIPAACALLSRPLEATWLSSLLFSTSLKSSLTAILLPMESTSPLSDAERKVFDEGRLAGANADDKAHSAAAGKQHEPGVRGLPCWQDSHECTALKSRWPCNRTSSALFCHTHQQGQG